MNTVLEEKITPTSEVATRAAMWAHSMERRVVETPTGPMLDERFKREVSRIYYKLGRVFLSENPQAGREEINAHLISISKDNPEDPLKHAQKFLDEKAWNKIAGKVFRAAQKAQKRTLQMERTRQLKGTEYAAKAIAFIRNAYQKEIHPYGLLFPFLDESEIITLGLRMDGSENVEVITYKGKILDGKNILLAAHDAHRKVVFVEYQGDDPLKFVLTRNLHRRHLRDAQRAMMGAMLVTTELGSNQYEGLSIDGSTQARISQEKAASLVNSSVSSIGRAMEIRKSGDQELIDDVLYGRERGGGALEKFGIKIKKESTEPEWQRGYRSSMSAFKRLGFSEDFAGNALRTLSLAGETDAKEFIRNAVMAGIDSLINKQKESGLTETERVDARKTKGDENAQSI